MASIREEVAEYTTAEAVVAYSSQLEDGPESELAAARLAALAERLTGDIASDTIAELQDRIEDVEDEQEPRNTGWHPLEKSSKRRVAAS